MVVPSPTLFRAAFGKFRLNNKPFLRAQLRRARRDHVAGLPASVSALVFSRPPQAVVGLAGPVVGLYHAVGAEAPARAYAKWFSENGRVIALPWFADAEAPMQFRQWMDPYDDASLVSDPFGARQPAADAPLVEPDTLFVPLVGFTPEGHRLGQGGGHYDRYLAAHRDVVAMGLAWDCQRVEEIPAEEHDMPLRAVITPTRLYGDLG
jgi:5-formyltetrahydrofolate cyclo-ligase